MAGIWNSIRDFFGFKPKYRCEQRGDQKWYCQKLVSGRWEDCIPPVPYDTEEECKANAGNC